MYSFTKEKNTSKRRLIVALSCVLVIAVAFISYEYTSRKDKEDTAVFKESVPVLSLPDTTQKGIHPFNVEAKTVLEYFDGKDHEVDSMTKFEGVYRANQGIDYACNDEAFDVLAVFAGDVSEVKEDALFGKSVTIKSKDLSITYQSLDDVALKQGDKVNQGDAIAKAGTNIYNKELGKHLHMVVEKNGTIIDPKTVFDKTLSEIK